jgi:hypothetical protein
MGRDIVQMRMGFRHSPSRFDPEYKMTYINWGSISAVEAKRSFIRRIHWERIALIAINAGLWAMIIGLFT